MDRKTLSRAALLELGLRSLKLGTFAQGLLRQSGLSEQHRPPRAIGPDFLDGLTARG
jgi:hypothetical protein